MNRRGFGLVFRVGTGIEHFALLHPCHLISEVSSQVVGSLVVLGGRVVTLPLITSPVSWLYIPEQGHNFPPPP